MMRRPPRRTCVRDPAFRGNLIQMGQRGLEPSQDSWAKAGIGSEGGAESGALGGDSAASEPKETAPTDPDLAALGALWPGLPPATRAAILTLSRAAAESGR